MVAKPDTSDITSVTKQATLTEGADAAGNSGTSAVMSVGDTFDGTISSSSETDWVRIQLDAGQSYVFSAWGTNGTSGLDDTVLTLYDGNGTQVATNDDLNRYLLFSGIQYTAPVSGTYYIEVSGYRSKTGDYTLQAATDVYTTEQIATYMTEVDWGFTTPLRLDAQAGGTLTYNTSALTAEGRQLAEWALESWSIATGITFIPSGSASADIIFDDSQSGAFAGPSSIDPSTGISSQATVNISTQWLQTYGTTIDSYSFETYLHEIGHALGLGHSGPYDGTATYGTDNLYANDSVQMTVMSYFTPSENPTILGSNVALVSPMMADYFAMDLLYGGTQTYHGNTTWGANSNVGGWLGDLMGIVFDGDPANPGFYSGGPIGWTIRDTGGIDTIDVSTVSANQRVDLRAERFSDINGSVNNVAIAAGSVIENAIGGSGHDTLRGNEANNRLEGNAGNDTVNGAEGTDTAVLDVTRASVSVSQSGSSGIQIVSALGTDIYRNVEFFEFSDQTVSASTLLGFDQPGEVRTGTPGPDTLIGTSRSDTISGLAGDDTIDAGNGDDQISASDGNDSVAAGGGHDNIGGGLGNDTVKGGAGNDTIGAGQGDDIVTGGEGDDGLYGGAGNDNISGEGGHDDIGAGFNDDTVSGGDGNDNMGGGTGRDVIGGGAGNDTIGGGEGDDTISGGVGDDFIAGGGRNDVLNGGAGSDRINGGAGSDTMTGNEGADTFIFSAFYNGDTDVITDFQDGIDKIQMSGVQNAPGSGLQGYVDALNVTTVAGGVQLSYGGNKIILEGLSASQIDVDDFIFV